MSAVGNNSQAQAVTRRVAATYESSSSQKDRIAAAFLFVYWIVYENAIGYEATAVSFALTVAVDLVKLAFPLIALVLLGIPARWDRSTAVYLALFGLFLAWSAVPTALYANSSDYAEYLKLWPRAVFAVAAVALFRRSGGLNLLGKLTVSYAALALPQYVLAHLCTMFGVPLERMIYGNLMWAGPFGILGNTNSTGVIGGYEFFQLRGFWNEPSNAAAILFSSYYVAEYLARTGRSRLWRFLGRTCLIAGLLTFSLAGYAALAVAMFAGKITIFF